MPFCDHLSSSEDGVDTIFQVGHLKVLGRSHCGTKGRMYLFVLVPRPDRSSKTVVEPGPWTTNQNDIVILLVWNIIPAGLARELSGRFRQAVPVHLVVSAYTRVF